MFDMPDIFIDIHANFQKLGYLPDKWKLYS